MTIIDSTVAVPDTISSWLTHIQSTFEQYGWYMLFGLIAFIVIKNHLEEYWKKKSVYDPSRIDRLELERRQIRLQQQQKWLEKSAEIYQNEQETGKNKSDEDKRLDRLYKENGRPPKPDTDSMTDLLGGGFMKKNPRTGKSSWSSGAPSSGGFKPYNKAPAPVRRRGG